MEDGLISQEILTATKTLGPSLLSVAIFGSGEISATHPDYSKAHDLAFQLSAQGISVLTGGGGGIMEAANQGAARGKAASIGLCLSLPNYEKKNKFIHPGKAFLFSNFFSRKAVFLKYAQGIVCFPGGLGTLDELFEVLIAMRAQKLPLLPLYLIGTEFWGGLIQWLTDAVFKQNLAPRELLEHIKIADDIQEVASLLSHRLLSNTSTD